MIELSMIIVDLKDNTRLFIWWNWVLIVDDWFVGCVVMKILFDEIWDTLYVEFATKIVING